MKLILIIAATIALALAHGHAKMAEKPEGMSWQDWHMKEEHDLEEYDAETFFKLHNIAGTGDWDNTDILNIYGLMRDQVVGDGSGMGEHTHHEQEIINPGAKDHVVSTILSLLDTDGDGKVSLDEWKQYLKHGGKLPDFGYGQGHHLDFESEYEEHHWKKYHAKDDPDVKIKHKEDIEHELLHHEHEMEETHDSAPDREFTAGFFSEIRLDNLPQKYRR